MSADKDTLPARGHDTILSARSTPRTLTARIEPFDSYWQAPKDIEKGYKSFRQYYKSNFLSHLPRSRDTSVLVVSCGPGYLVSLLNQSGYKNVTGIDSDPAKIAYTTARGLSCLTVPAFEFLAQSETSYDAIVCEQEMNHLTLQEMLEFLGLCRRNLTPGGSLIVYGLNGADPIVGAENLAHNIDHFNTFTEYSLRQILELAGFVEIELLPLKLYVFWSNPLNYVGLAATAILSLLFRMLFVLYGKDARIFTKKIAAVCRKPAR